MEGVVGTVFIVDDAREVRMGLSRVLGAAGYPVRSFESAGLFLDQQDATLTIAPRPGNKITNIHGRYQNRPQTSAI